MTIFFLWKLFVWSCLYSQIDLKKITVMWKSYLPVANWIGEVNPYIYAADMNERVKLIKSF